MKASLLRERKMVGSPHRTVAGSGSGSGDGSGDGDGDGYGDGYG